MGKKGDAAKTGLAVAFLASGGAVASQASAATPDNVQSVVSSYFGGLGLQDNFHTYLKVETGFENFDKYYKETPADATRLVIKFSFANEVAPPPGFVDIDDGGIG